MGAQAFHPSTWEAEAGRSLSLEASLVYKARSRTARTTQKNPVSKKKKKERIGEEKEGRTVHENIMPSEVNQINQTPKTALCLPYLRFQEESRT